MCSLKAIQAFESILTLEAIGTQQQNSPCTHKGFVHKGLRKNGDVSPSYMTLNRWHQTKIKGHKRTKLNIDQIIQLLELCLDTTYFSFREQIFKQTHGAAMGSPVSPIVANLYMEYFEEKAIESAKHKPSHCTTM